ncbi:MAG: CPBP family intramembrane metalloprotease [Anaerolineae bacterium]|nr:CPBP family intramembrane metalloprotease [Anaerolineae bacterium]
MKEKVYDEQHTLIYSVILHLLPGALIGACYFVLIPILRSLGYPSMMALMCAIPLTLLPVELGYLLYEGRRRNGRLSLQGVVLYRDPIPLWQYFVGVPLLFIALGLIFTLMKPVDVFFREQVFAWLPALAGGLDAGYSPNILIITWTMVAVFGVFVGPTVEELYFRGYLLPRMEYAGEWAPLFHCLLFGLYHFWTPWMFLTRTLGILPLAYAARWRNLYLAIIVHVLVNMLDVFTAVAFITAMSGTA